MKPMIGSRVFSEGVFQLWVKLLYNICIYIYMYTCMYINIFVMYNVHIFIYTEYIYIYLELVNVFFILGLFQPFAEDPFEIKTNVSWVLSTRVATFLLQCPRHVSRPGEICPGMQVRKSPEGFCFWAPLLESYLFKQLSGKTPLLL